MQTHSDDVALLMQETVAREGRLLPAGSRQALGAASALALLRGRLADLADSPPPTRVMMLGTIAMRGRLFVEGASTSVDACTALHLVRRGYARVQATAGGVDGSRG